MHGIEPGRDVDTMGVERIPAPHTMTMYGVFGASQHPGTRVLVASSLLLPTLLVEDLGSFLRQ